MAERVAASWLSHGAIWTTCFHMLQETVEIRNLIWLSKPVVLRDWRKHGGRNEVRRVGGG